MIKNKDLFSIKLFVDHPSPIVSYKTQRSSSYKMLIVTFGVLSLTLILVYYKWRHQYWRRKNVPFLTPSIPFGNLKNPFNLKENVGETIHTIYNEMKKRKWKHGGIYQFTSPVYVVLDLEYVKNILTKDFDHFIDRGFYYNEKDDPLSAHLFALGGSKWRNLRHKISPTFTSGKMKLMFPSMVECAKNLEERLRVEFEKNEPIDIREVLACYTTDIIGSCAFGLDIKSFKDSNSPFRVYGRKVFAETNAIKMTFATTFPDFSRKLRLILSPNDATEFFLNVVKENVSYREKNSYFRNDFIQLLTEIKNKRKCDETDNLTVEEIAAQCFVFFLAGFETSSNTMAYAFYELARHQDVQDKLRDEIQTVMKRHDGKISYSSLQELKYMDQVLDETLRKYPTLFSITRRCIKDYKIPDENIIIEKGTTVVISALGIHYDEEYYPDPQKFDPERFSEENKKSRHQYAHLAFGGGPRRCIGMRFGVMEAKIGFISLLKEYKFTVNQKTEDPLKMKVNSFVVAPQGEIWLNAEKLQIPI
ncbi:probable cytochrome P450 6a23 isoform X2 [Zophobas morio]|uniref:probable cytochrome P450 6a23 isoform X2 n=1 Tax=Zophobas morio TaxID=2755281 RepID=UPI003082E029